MNAFHRLVSSFFAFSSPHLLRVCLGSSVYLDSIFCCPDQIIRSRHCAVTLSVSVHKLTSMRFFFLHFRTHFVILHLNFSGCSSSPPTPAFVVILHHIYAVFDCAFSRSVNLGFPSFFPVSSLSVFRDRLFHQLQPQHGDHHRRRKSIALI